MKLKSNDRYKIQRFLIGQVKIAMCMKNHTKKQAAKEMIIDYKHFCKATHDPYHNISFDIFIAFCEYCDFDIVDSIKRTHPIYM